MTRSTLSCGDVIFSYITSPDVLFYIDTCFFELKKELQGRATPPGIRFFTRHLPEFRESGKKVRVHTKFWEEITKLQHLPHMQASIDYIRENAEIFETFSTSYPDEEKINLDEILRRCTVESKGKAVILTGDHNFAETMQREKNCEDILFAPRIGNLSTVMRWKDYTTARLRHQFKNYDIVVTSSAVGHKGYANLLQKIDTLNQQGNTFQPIYTSLAKARLHSDITPTSKLQEDELIELNTQYLSRCAGRKLIIVAGRGHIVFQNRIKEVMAEIEGTCHMNHRDKVFLNGLTPLGTIIPHHTDSGKAKQSQKTSQAPGVPSPQANPFTELIEQWATRIAAHNNTSIMETLQKFPLSDILGILAARYQDGIGFKKDTQLAEEIRNYRRTLINATAI